MTQLKSLLLFLACFWIGLTCAFAMPNEQTDPKTIEQLNKYRRDYISSIREAKPDKLAALYAPAIRLMPEFQKTIKGKTNALAYYKAFFARFALLEYSRDPLEVLDLGSQVVETGMFRSLIKSKKTGQTHELLGKYQAFWEKQEGGKLALLTEAWNYNQYLEIADQLRFEEVPVVHVALEGHVPIKNNISFELAALNRLQEIVISQHDATLWSQFYTDDVKLIYSNHPLYDGRNKVDEFLAAHIKQLPVFEKLDIRNDQIDDLGNYVIEYASHIALYRHGEHSGTSTGKDIRIWRREPNGSLKIVRQMAMYD